jgi:hypothetical protein
VNFCCEAGPCGYGVHRTLTKLGEDCMVVAPSMIPRKSGDRQRNDKRDAASLAVLQRGGLLTAVWPERTKCPPSSDAPGAVAGEHGGAIRHARGGPIERVDLPAPPEHWLEAAETRVCSA